MTDIKWSWEHAFRDSELTSTQKLILYTLNSHMAPDGKGCWPSLNTLAREASVDRRTVMRNLDDLEAAGWVCKQHQSEGKAHQSTFYIPGWGHGAPRGRADTGVEAQRPPNRSVNKSLVIREGVDNSAWEDYTQHRKEIGKSFTKLAAERQMKFLAGYTPEKQALIVDQSIRNGWTGLFELKESHGNRRTNELPGANRTQSYTDSELTKLAKPGESWDDVKRRLSRQEH